MCSNVNCYYVVLSWISIHFILFIFYQVLCMWLIVEVMQYFRVLWDVIICNCHCCHIIHFSLGVMLLFNEFFISGDNYAILLLISCPFWFFLSSNIYITHIERVCVIFKDIVVLINVIHILTYVVIHFSVGFLKV